MSEENVNPPIKSNQSNPEASNGEIQESQKAQGRWEEDQHIRFLNGVMQYGKDWKLVQKVVKSRTGTQVRSHAQKYFLKLRRQQKDKKKNKNKQFIGPTQLEEEIILFFTQSDITMHTPPQFISVLQVSSTFNKESLSFNINPEHLELNEAKGKKFDEREVGDKRIFDPYRFIKNQRQRKGQQICNPLFRGIREENMGISVEDQSFFISTIKNNIGLFKKIKTVFELTDIKEQPETPKLVMPKRSFISLSGEQEKNLQNTNEKKQTSVKQDGDSEKMQQQI